MRRIRNRTLSRRNFGQVLLGAPVLGRTTLSASLALASALDEEPLRTPFDMLMEGTPERPGADGDVYAMNGFANFADTNMTEALLARSSILPDGPATGVSSDEWQEFFGFAPEGIKAVVVQDDATGFLMIIEEHFDVDARKRMTATWESNHFAPIGSDQDYQQYIWKGLDNFYPAARLPHLTGLKKRHYAVLALSGQLRVLIASNPELSLTAHDAEQKRTDYMKQAPVVQSAIRNEHSAVFEALVLPGNRFEARQTDRHTCRYDAENIRA